MSRIVCINVVTVTSSPSEYQQIFDQKAGQEIKTMIDPKSTIELMQAC
jgi:hypothetical protein